MSANDKYKIYSAGEIRKYLDGELPAAEMHALEAAALEDPFLADALEGMEKDRLHRGAAMMPHDIEDLRKRLQDRVTKKDGTRILPIYRSWWRIAAAVVVIAGLGTLGSLYLFRNHGSSPVLGKTEKSSPTRDILSGNPPVSTDSEKVVADSRRAASTKGIADSQELVSIDKKRQPAQQPAGRIGTARPKELLKPVSAPSQAAAPGDQANSREPIQDLDSNSTSSSLAKDEIRRKKTLEAYYEKLKNDTTHLSLSKSDGYLKTAPFNKFLFVGKVIDSNDNPIPYATISFSSHHQATRTDNNGLFQFQLLGPKDSLAPVWVSSVGYHPVSLTINAMTLANNNALSNVIRLHPETTELNEVVTIGYGTHKKRAATRQETDEDRRDKGAGNTADKEADLVRHAAPVIGWTAYQNYLKKNRPLKGVDSTLKGAEVIYFEVDRKGRLSSFRVTQSLSPAHDSAVIHLIRQGPAWKPLEGKKAPATLTMSF